MLCIGPLTFLRQRHPPGHIDIIARTSNHRDQTSRSRWLKKLSLAERLEFVIQTTTHDVAGRFSIESLDSSEIIRSAKVLIVQAEIEIFGFN